MECLFGSKKYKDIKKGEFDISELPSRVFVLIYDDLHKDIILETFKSASKNICGVQFISYLDNEVGPILRYYRNGELEDEETTNFSYLSIFNFVNRK